MKYLLVALTTASVLVAGYFLLTLSPVERVSMELSASNNDHRTTSSGSLQTSLSDEGYSLLECKSDAISYAFQYVSKGQYYDQVQTSQINELTLNLSGTVFVSCKKLTNKFEQTWYFSEAKFSQSGYGMFSQVEKPHALMNGGIAVKVTLNKSFEIQKILTNQYDTMSSHLVKDILNWSRFTTGAGKQWHASEPDINGVTASQYKIISQKSDQVTISKTRQYLEQEPAVAYTKPQPKILVAKGSLAKFKLENHQLQSLNSDFTLMFMQKGRIVSKTQTTLVFQRENESIIIPSNALAFDAPVFDDMTSVQTQKRNDEMTQRKALGKDNWDTLESRLEFMPQEELTAVFLKLRALFRLHPDTLQEAGNWLLLHTPEEPSFGAVAIALAQSEQSAAANTLIESALKHTDFNAQRYLLGQSGLTLVSDSTADELLYELMKKPKSELSQVARLAVANMSATMKKDQKSRFESNYQQAVNDLKSATTEQAIINALHVVSNYATADNLAVVRNFTESKNPAIRIAAYLSLRQSPGVEVEDLYIDSLNRAINETEKLALAIELSFREVQESSLEVQSNIYKQAKSEQLRSVLVGNIGLGKNKYQWISGFIKKVAEDDPSESVRLKARSLL